MGTNLTFDLYQGCMIKNIFCGTFSPDRIPMKNFSKSTRPRDMLFLLKDTLSIEDVGSSVPQSHYMRQAPPHFKTLSQFPH